MQKQKEFSKQEAKLKELQSSEKQLQKKNQELEKEIKSQADRIISSEQAQTKFKLERDSLKT